MPRKADVISEGELNGSHTALRGPHSRRQPAHSCCSHLHLARRRPQGLEVHAHGAQPGRIAACSHGKERGPGYKWTGAPLLRQQSRFVRLPRTSLRTGVSTMP